MRTSIPHAQCITSKFQFQNGTIMSAEKRQSDMINYYFNSKMVRLWGMTITKAMINKLISIPKWYDYEGNFESKHLDIKSISIPKWYDYEENDYNQSND